jgi:selenocysteine lyase/cysteine desulfurase
VDFIASLGTGKTRREQLTSSFAAMHENDLLLTRTLWNGLNTIPGVRVYGPSPDSDRTSLVSFTVEGIRSSEVSEFLSERGLFASHGNFYAATVAERYGLAEHGFVRIGCSVYTTVEEIDRLLAAIGELISTR